MVMCYSSHRKLIQETDEVLPNADKGERTAELEGKLAEGLKGERGQVPYHLGE